jgi:hypothetical protein
VHDIFRARRVPGFHSVPSRARRRCSPSGIITTNVAPPDPHARATNGFAAAQRPQPVMRPRRSRARRRANEHRACRVPGLRVGASVLARLRGPSRADEVSGRDSPRSSVIRSGPVIHHESPPEKEAGTAAGNNP